MTRLRRLEALVRADARVPARLRRRTLTARSVIGLALADDAAPEPRLDLRPRRARPIRTAGEYVAVVRRLYPEACRRCGGQSPYREDCYYCAHTGAEPHPVADGRLIAPLWRGPAIPPREWAEGGRGREWLAYWRATQPRPDAVGSSYNDAPADAVRAWSLGIPAERYPRGQAHLLPPAWHGGQRRILVACRLARRKAPGVPAALRTAELRRLARLSGALLRAVGIPTAGRAVDWTEVARRHAEWLAVQPHRARLQAACVPAAWWRAWLGGDAEVRRDIEARHAERAKVAHAKRRRAQWEAATAARREREGISPGETPWRTVERYADGASLQRVRDYRQTRWLLAVPGTLGVSWDGCRPEPAVIAEGLAQLCRGRRNVVLAALRERVSELRAAWAFAFVAADTRERQAAEARRAAAIEARLTRRRARRAEDAALLGWRGWRLEAGWRLVPRPGADGISDAVPGGVILVSPHRPVRWEGPELVAADVANSGEVRGLAVVEGEARGRLNGDARHAPGIHATWDPRRRETEGTYDPRTMDVLGRVRGYGAFAAGPEGWRAERVIIDCLLVPVRFAAAVPALAMRYQCRVRVVRGWHGRA